MNPVTDAQPALYRILSLDGGRAKQSEVHCFDTDPVNATLAQYSELKAEHINVLRPSSINEKEFDTLVEKICCTRSLVRQVPNKRCIGEQ